MSEFKFACPVCGQHMKCDSSQAGSAMECPTCFQKITAPQAPASDEHKFILTGTKFIAKKSIESPAGTAVVPKVRAGRTMAVGISLVTIAVLAAASGMYFFQERHAGQKPRLGQSPDSGIGLAWQAEDIGDVGAAGSMSEADGVFTLKGSGADIWHRADGFQFVFQPLSGDGSLTARLLNNQYTDEWAKSGVMIRESTNASAPFALASARSDGQAQMIWRNAAGAEAQASMLAGGPGFPKWLKIVRRGNHFSAFYKLNAGDEWLPMGTPQTICMGTNAVIGLVVCSHNKGTLCQAQLDEVSLQTDDQAAGR